MSGPSSDGMTLQDNDIRQTEMASKFEKKYIFAFWQSKDLCGCFLFYTWKARRERRRRWGVLKNYRFLSKSSISQCCRWTDKFHQNFPGGLWCPTLLLLLIIFSKSTLHSTISVPSLVQTGAILKDYHQILAFLGTVGKKWYHVIGSVVIPQSRKKTNRCWTLMFR